MFYMCKYFRRSDFFVFVYREPSVSALNRLRVTYRPFSKSLFMYTWNECKCLISNGNRCFWLHHTSFQRTKTNKWTCSFRCLRIVTTWKFHRKSRFSRFIANSPALQPAILDIKHLTDSPTDGVLWLRRLKVFLNC